MNLNKRSRQKPKQIKWTLPTGNDSQGTERLERWREASLRVMKDPKLFNAWLRQTLDEAAERILDK